MTKKSVQTKKKRVLRKKMKKAICTAMSVIFMASAILVAAIPVETIQAADMIDIAVDDAQYIPQITSADTIYSTGDGMFQFVYKNRIGSAEQVAILVGYDYVGALAGGNLRIPDTVDAYFNTLEGKVAVGRDGSYLYYPVYEDVERETGQIITETTTDVHGNVITVSRNEVEIVQELKKFELCYYNTESEWNKEGVTLYYKLNTSNEDNSAASKSNFAEAVTENKAWLKKAPLAYISNQHSKWVDGATKAEAGKWVLVEDPAESENGVFTEKGGNISNLTIGDGLLGIGSYAFRGCNSLRTITLSNGITTIGNYAFADCRNLATVTIDPGALVKKIGEGAFSNCQALQSFVLPTNVEEIGNSAFEGCTSMTDFQFVAEGMNPSLQSIGSYAFRNCTSLTGLTFPETFTQVADSNQEIGASLVQGCTSLEYITIPSRNLNFTDDAAYTINQFKTQVGDTFYFASYDVSQIHETATTNSIAFKYLDGDKLYEKVVKEKDNNGNEIDGVTHRMTYRVDEENNLRYFEMGKDVTNVEIPAAIGPYNILRIGSDSFQGNCMLEKITIPSSIIEIENYAFQGCHNLKDVIYEEPINLVTIGEGAFNTQVVEGGKECIADKGNYCVDLVNEVRKPVLTFTGTISPESVPFQYAMNPENNINRGRQEVSHITFFSGWPSNLTVRHNTETGLNELVRYPTYTELKTGALVDENNQAYPYMTDDYREAAKNAVSQYEAYLMDSTVQLTQDQWDIINAVLNIELPTGITGIKEGIFSGIDAEGNTVSTNGLGKNNEVKSIIVNSVSDIPAYAFYGCEDLESVVVNSSGNAEGDSIGDYAFGDCDELTSVVLSANITQMGKRPFVDCEKLTHVTVEEGGNFICENGIIYGLTGGVKSSVVQCLETRGASGEYSVGHPMVSSTEMEGITSIQEEAFMDCEEIGVVDLTLSQVETIPEKCFENTSKLNAVYLPDTTLSIETDAFKNSNVYNLRLPKSLVYIDPTAFTDSNGETLRNIRVDCAEDTYAWRYTKANEPYGWQVGAILAGPFRVMFFDWNGAILSDQTVEYDADAVAPENPTREGYTFVGWDKDFTRVVSDLTVSAVYTQDGLGAGSDSNTADGISTFLVTFYDKDNNIISQQVVAKGEDAIAPPAPTVEGYNFTGWRQSYTDIQKHTDVYAEYQMIDSSEANYTVTFYNYDETIVSRQSVVPGGTPVTPIPPTREGYEFTGWLPSYTNVTKDLDVFAQFEKKATNGKSTSTSDSAKHEGTVSENESNDTEMYVVTVENGSGSGSYEPGATVTITAFDLVGKKFSNWSTSATDFTISDVTSKQATFTMPKHAVNIVAKYTTTSTTTNRNPSGTTSGNTINKRPISNSNSGGTIVDINKTGISNKDKASASVSGSSDDFIVKITDDETARALVEQALLAEYGTLENIKYFAMDISLYDKTGRNKITNTDGLSVTITIPLPDALAQYAGNNKTASVVNGKLDKLNPRFTTIDGVPCVSFVATHFSPYTIYVDTANLTAGTIQDSTPTTGDPIHPKWFLVIGLAILSVLMFGARGSKQKIIVEV